MAKAFIPAALSANHLLEGDAVWWTGASWSRSIEDALIARTKEEAEALLATGGAAEQEAHVVGPYLVDLAPGEVIRPLSRREAIRADREPTFAYGAAPALEKAA